MSKIGKKPISLQNIEAKLNENVLNIKGPKGNLSLEIHPKVKLDISDSKINISVASLEDWNLRGLFRTLVDNMVVGVTQGYAKKLLVLGVGYNAKLLNPKKLEFSLGFSHKVYFDIPDGIDCSMEKDSKGNDILVLSSIDKQLLGQVASNIRGLKKPEPYKGKGIRYIDEAVKLKAGKSAKK